MSRIVAFLLIAITLFLVGLGWIRSGGLTRHEILSASTPTEAVQAVLADVQSHDWDRAYALLANANDIEQPAFVRDLLGSNGSLRTYSSLDSFDVWPLHTSGDQATVRANLHWSTALGSIDDVRDLTVQRKDGSWKVDWPVPNFPKVPPQVIPVNYLRWDIINRGPEDTWGEQNVDTPQVRILSMNPVERPDRLIIIGEVVNEDTVPAYVNVNATLLDPNQSPLSQVRSVRMDIKAMLVPASADPVIEVSSQRMDKDAMGKNVLRGQLINESGQTVNIAQALAAFYDNKGKVIWVSAGYLDQALLPQTPVGFAVDLPPDVAARVHNSHVTVNHYTVGNNS